MANAAAVRAKLDRVLARLNVTDRQVYMRLTSQLGGDPLTGRGSQAQKDDTLLNPQPAVTVAAKNYPMIIAGEALSSDAEYLLLVSATAMTKAQVTDPKMSLVFKDVSGVEESFFICGFEATVLGGADISFNLILSSKKR